MSINVDTHFFSLWLGRAGLMGASLCCLGISQRVYWSSGYANGLLEALGVVRKVAGEDGSSTEVENLESAVSLIHSKLRVSHIAGGFALLFAFIAGAL